MNLMSILRNKNFYLMLFADVVFHSIGLQPGYLIRFEGKLPLEQWIHLKTTLPYIIICKLIIFYFCGLYKGMWRYTSFEDLKSIFNATIISSFIIISSILFINRFRGYSRSIFVIDFMLTFIFICAARVAVRLFFGRNEASFWPFVHSRKKMIENYLLSVLEIPVKKCFEKSSNMHQ